MLIVCDNCGAEYEVEVGDDLGSQPGRGLRFRCSACGHTFSISDDSARSGERSSEHGAQAAPVEAPPQMLLKQEGKVYQVEDVATLQRWIVERRVLREDMLSIGGLKWEPVGSRRELQVFFHLIEHAERGEGAEGAGPPLSEGEPGLAMRGAAPWERGQDDGAARHDATISNLPFDAPESDLDEVEHDEGTDAGLPLPDLVVRASTRSDEAVDQALLAAPDPGHLPRHIVPNLAPGGRAVTDAAQSMGPAVMPPLVDEAELQTVEIPRRPTGDLPQDMLFPEETEEVARPPAPVGTWEEPLPRRQGVPPWAWALGLAVILLGVLWVAWKQNPRSAPTDGPAPASVGASSTGASSTGASSTGATALSASGAARTVPARTVPAAAPSTAAPSTAAPSTAAPSTAAPAVAAGVPANRTASTGSASTEAPPASSAAASLTPGASTSRTSTQPEAAATPGSTDAATPRSTGVSAARRVDQGWSAMEKGRYSDAKRIFEGVLAEQPGSTDARFGRAYASEKLGSRDAAVRDYCTVAAAGSGEAQSEAQGRLRALSATCE